MVKNRLTYLLEKHINDTISSEEAFELFKLIQEVELSIQEEVWDDVLRNHNPSERLPIDKKRLIYKRIQQALQLDNGRQQYTDSRVKVAVWIKSIAAAALIITGFVWYHTANRNDSHEIEANMGVHSLNDVYLNTDNGPNLQLPNGHIQQLDGLSATDLVALGIDITIDNNGQKIYQVQRHTGQERLGVQKQKMVFSTPKGQSSKIILSDGTTVWLNSGSLLEYPIAFTGDERRVKLQGEAFFEVQHVEDQRFYVETGRGPLIQVIGTAFNVMAYQEQDKITTTLVEGNVRLLGQNQQVSMRPNEQVTAAMIDNQMDIESVNVQEFISWKEGYFHFNRQTIPEMLLTVQRWYDIEDIEYRYLPKEKFTGTFKRTKSLRSLLKKLEIIGEVKFDITERRVVVMK